MSAAGSAPKAIGTFPTPYGVSVPVYELNDPTDPEAVSFDVSGTLTCSGIHDPQQRAAAIRAIAARATTGDIFSFISQFGGQPVPRMPLSRIRSSSSTYNDLPEGFDVRRVIDAWVDRITELHRWCDRAEHLQELLDRHVKDWAGGLPDKLIAFALSRILTSVLENLGEAEIDCLEAAAFYAFAEHDAWRAAAVAWLTPMRSTWWTDWRNARGGYRQFAGIARELYTDLPDWIAA